MSLLNLALYGNEDPKKKKLNLTPQYRTAAELAGASNYVAPASTTVTYQPAPVPQRTIADYAPPPTYWNSSGDLKINYAGGDPYSYDSRRYNGRVIRDMQNEREWDAAKNIGAFGLSVLSDPIALGMSAFDFAKDPSLSNAAFLGLDALTPGNIGGFLKGLTEIGVVGAGAREFAKKGIGRIVTNLVSPVSYDNKIGELVDLYKQKGFQPLAKSVIDDIPVYEIRVPDREFPYRKMYGLEPRDVQVYSQPYTHQEDTFSFSQGKHYAIDGQRNFGDDFTYEGIYPNPIKNSDGTYTLDKNSLALEEIYERHGLNQFTPSMDYTKEQTVGNLYNSLFGKYSINWNPRKGEALAIDDWDFDLHPGEFKKAWETAKNNYDYNKELRNYAKANNIKGGEVGTPFLKSLRDSGEFLSSTALRYAMSKITDPIKYRVPLDIPNNSVLNDHITHSLLRKFGRASEWNAPNIIRKYDDFPF